MSETRSGDVLVAELVPLRPAAAGGSPALATFRRASRLGRTRLGLALVGVVVLVAVVGPLVAGSPEGFAGPPFQPAGRGTLAGTDYLGRDVVARFLWGGLSVLALATVATVLGVAAGVFIGLWAGYSRTWVDDAVMRTLDVLLAFPQVIFALLLVSTIGPELWLLVVAIAVTNAPRVARVTRGATLEVAQRDFIRAAQAIGVPRRDILLREILPNISSPVLVELGLRLTYSIGVVAALSFLGFGLQPPAADWGLMINENRIGLTVQPWAVVLPAGAVALLTIGTNLVTDGLSRAMVGLDRGSAGW
jgi:peptide/nickel transport system permease protein